MGVIEVQVITNKGPGGFANAKNKFVEKFDDQINHKDNKTSEINGAVRL